ncbi:MAG: hypothetical protein KatS3mg035_1449 [Bacteroidia bacterium]|nr:MAG: hypothetical protein KatS3mg035_1449 [Bacteroidia bacterium]
MDAPSFGIGVFNKEKYLLEFPGYLEKSKKIEGAVYDLNEYESLCYPMFFK